MKRVLALAAFVTMLITAACTPASVPDASLPAGAITRDNAISVAGGHAGPGAQFISAAVGNRAGFVPADPSLIDTWIVKFTGNFPRGCPPGGSCPREVHFATVFVDLFSGEIVGAEYS